MRCASAATPSWPTARRLRWAEPEGLVKTVFDKKTGELLGAHMIGAEVTELIQGFGIAKTLETTEAELMHAIFPHPTLSEMMHESVLDAYGKAINFLSIWEQMQGGGLFCILGLRYLSPSNDSRGRPRI